METEIKKGLSRKRKWQILGIVLAAVLLVSIIPITSKAGESTAKNVTSSHVKFTETTVQLKNVGNSEYETYTGQDIYRNKTIKIDVLWNIPSVAGIAAGDFITVNLPPYFDYKDGTKGTGSDFYVDIKDSEGKKSSEKAGILSFTEDNKVKLVISESFLHTLTEKGIESIDNGEFTVIAAALATEDVTKPVTIGDSSINFKYVPEPTYKLGAKGYTDKKIGKECQSSSNGNLDWNIYTEDMLLAEIFGKPSEKTRENVVIEDALTGGAVFADDFKPMIYQRLYYIQKTADGGKRVLNSSFTVTYTNNAEKYPFTKVEDDGTLNYEQFKEKVMENPMQFGVYNKNKVIIHLGTMAGDVKMPAWSAVEGYFNNKTSLTVSQTTIDGEEYKELVKSTLDTYKDLLYKDGTGASDRPSALSVIVRLDTEPVKLGRHENIAYISWKNSDIYSASSNPEVKGLSGTASAATGKRAVTLNKYDGEEKTSMAGVEFRLERLDESDNTYKPYREDPVKSTSENGTINYTSLFPGKYQFVETSAPDDYDMDKVEFTDQDGKTITNGGFTIGNKTEEIIINAYNYKKEVIEEETPTEEKVTEDAITTPTPLKVAGEEATPTAIEGQETVIQGEGEGDVLGQEETPNTTEEGSVLGDEAKTSDAMNMVPLLIIIAAMALFILLIATRTRGKNN